MSADRGHGHGHDHGAHGDEHADHERAGHGHEHPGSEPPAELVRRVQALEQLLIEKGLVDPAALDALIDTYEYQVGPHNGARVVARAWVDAAFKQRLLADGTAAVAEFGFVGRQTDKLVVLENTAARHHLVVCTLCSCYPWAVLGLPPVWYKSAPYRARAVLDPRGVLAEFGVELGPDVDVQVWDSTAEIRYLVLPERPSRTERLREEELAALVTRDAMIGTALVAAPAAAAPVATAPVATGEAR